MAPPPATPTPHRFLVPKRSQPRNETPKGFQSGGQQFHTTPRFSLHSTPRASGSHASSTPVQTGAFNRPRNTDPINDIIDSSPPFAEQPDDDQHEFIEQDVVPESSQAQESDYGNDQSDSEETPGPRASKRRRISVSSELSIDEAPHPGNIEGRIHDEDGDIDIQSSPHFPLSYIPEQDIDIQSSMSDEEADEDEYEDEDTETFPLTRPGAQQPTFHKAPRFKPTEVPEGSNHHHEPAPDAFSPHGRKGAKYLPGGLAAEVRDWFVDVRAGAGAGTRREEDLVAKVQVEEVREAPGMVLVTGRIVRDEDIAAVDDGASAERVRIVLTGSPRLHGLARRQEVRPGVVIGVAKPTWEVALLEQGRWAVVCEWVILS
ncbi:hypothetical protein F5B20DRAFT_70881 [Whalleya microplaca]|nr:hypothetical protein F5B20DRAFT_70881 [Whalleya microplaca]